MMTQATVRLWGTDIGYVTFDSERQMADFEYARDFLSSGMEISPLRMPLATRV